MTQQTIAPQVIWVTGLSGAGKTTVSKILAAKLREAGITPVMLDGDEIRAALGAENLHSRPDREKLALSYARLAKLLMDQGHVVICATISMYEPVHDWRYANIPNLTEIYLKVPSEELTRRDSKGLYGAKPEAPPTDVAGKHFSVEEPHSPTLVLTNWGNKSAQESAQEIFDALIRH